ncbi:MAG: hypothetical protein NC340_08040 [Ruminococcus flavefaciens]|nr:hypothetical protein [Ruminococcus flavefaciens]MCM1229928.1 hypothetical protein [Ruminococcus flavefaciens]
MKKTAIILTLCTLASLAGCGKIDSSEESKPLTIQELIVNPTYDDKAEPEEW